MASVGEDRPKDQVGKNNFSQAEREKGRCPLVELSAWEQQVLILSPPPDACCCSVFETLLRMPFKREKRNWEGEVSAQRKRETTTKRLLPPNKEDDETGFLPLFSLWLPNVQTDLENPRGGKSKKRNLAQRRSLTKCVRLEARQRKMTKDLKRNFPTWMRFFCGALDENSSQWLYGATWILSNRPGGVTWHH